MNHHRPLRKTAQQTQTKAPDDWEDAVEAYFAYNTLQAQLDDDEDRSHEYLTRWNMWREDRLLPDVDRLMVEEWMARQKLITEVQAVHRQQKRRTWVLLTIPVVAFSISLAWATKTHQAYLAAMSATGLLSWTAVAYSTKKMIRRAREERP